MRPAFPARFALSGVLAALGLGLTAEASAQVSAVSSPVEASAASAAAETKPVSAWEVQRACANPRLPSTERLHQICRLQPTEGSWAEWRRIPDASYDEADAVHRYAQHTVDVVLPAAFERLARQPGTEAARAEIAERLQDRDPGRFSRAVQVAVGPEARLQLLAGIQATDSANWVRLKARLNAGERGYLSRVEQANDAGFPSAAAGLADDADAAAARSATDRVLSAPFANVGEAFTGLDADAQIEVIREHAPDVGVDDLLARESFTAQTRDFLNVAKAGIAGAADARSVAATLLPLGQQSAVLWGVADYVAGRAERQFQAYFLQRFSGVFCKDYRPMLASSCGVLDGATLRSFRPGLGTLRQAVRRDLEVLPATSLRTGMMLAKAELAGHDSLVDALHLAASGAQLVVDVIRGEDPTVALAQVADSVFAVAGFDPAKAPAAALLAQFAAVHAGLLDPETRSTLLKLEGGTAPEEELRYLLLAFAINQPLAWKHLPFQPENVYPLARDVNDAVVRLRAASEALEALRRTASDTSTALKARRRELVAASANLLDGFLARGAERPELQQLRLGRIRRWTAPLRGVAVSLADADYASAVLSMADLAAPYAAAFEKRVAVIQDTRLFAFAADIAQAEDPAAVGAALSRYAGEGGGDFSSKRASHRVRASVNTYLGMYGGGFLGDPKWYFGEEPEQGKRAAFAGPYLPVGVEITVPPIFGGTPNVGRLGLFVQGLDLGALAAWRLEDDTEADASEVADEPEVGLEQVFAPGAFVVWNVPGMPVTVGWGVSYSPQLRKIGEGTPEEAKVDVVRRGFFVGFDVPLFP
jgi:hypothetical protein